MLSRYRLLMLLMVAMTVSFTAAGATVGDVAFQGAGVVFGLLLGFVALQYVFVYRSVDKLAGLSRFSTWCYLQPYRKAVFMVGLLVVAGAIQCFTQEREGGLFQVIERYGLVFGKSLSEPWRYLTGPFFHSGLTHWLANVSLQTIAATLAFALGRASIVWMIYLLGVLAPGVLLTFLPHWIGLDAYLGVSGGVYALLGWLGGVTFRRRLEFPNDLWWVIGYFSVATLLSASLLDHRASWFAHVLGLVTGYAAGLSLLGLRQELRRKGADR
jgi:membrane associated rhomboid family serine protease